MDGRRAKRTTGFAVVATSGTRSIPEESAPRAFTSGLQPSAFHALAGRCIRIGMCGEQLDARSFTVISSREEQARAAGVASERERINAK